MWKMPVFFLSFNKVNYYFRKIRCIFVGILVCFFRISYCFSNLILIVFIFKYTSFNDKKNFKTLCTMYCLLNFQNRSLTIKNDVFIINISTRYLQA